VAKYYKLKVRIIITMDPQDHVNLAMTIPGEDESWLNSDWLKGSEISPNVRSSVVNWLIQVSNYLQLSDISLHLGVSYLDLVIEKVSVELEEVQMMGLVCLGVAAKTLEDSAPSLRSMLPLIGDLASMSDLVRLEKEMLVVLEWKLTRTTPAVFLHYFSQLWPNKGRLFRVARAVLDYCLTQSWYGTVKPSILASTVLLTSNCLLGISWSDDLFQITQNHSKQLLPLTRKVLGLVKAGNIGDGVEEKHVKTLSKLGAVGQEKVDIVIKDLEVRILIDIKTFYYFH